MRALLLVLCLAGIAHGQEAPVLRLETGYHDQAVRGLAADLQQGLVLTGSEDRTARLWDLAGAGLLRTLRPHLDLPGAGLEGLIQSVALSPDGKLALLGACTLVDSTGKGVVYVFELGSGRLVRRIPQPGIEGVPLVTVSPDGRRVAAVLGVHGVRVYTLPGGAQVPFSGEEPGRAYGADFDHKGRLLVAEHDGVVRIYDGRLQPLSRTQLTGGPMVVRASPDGGKVAVGLREDGRVQLLSGEDLTPLAAIPGHGQGLDGRVTALAWSLDGDRLYVATYGSSGGAVLRRFHRLSSGAPALLGDVRVGQAPIWQMAATADGVVFPAPGGFARITRDGRIERPMPAPLRPRRLLVSEDGGTVQVEGEGAPLRFSLKERSLLVSPPPDPSLPSLRPPSTKDPALEVSGWDGGIPLLRGQPLLPESRTADGAPAERARALALFPDGLVLGTDYQVLRFDRHGTNRWSVDVPGGATAVNVAAGAGLVLAALGDGTVRWYRGSDGAELLALYLHPDRRRWVLFTPTGLYDAAVGAEELLGWHLDRGTEQAADFLRAARLRAALLRPERIAEVLRTLTPAPAPPELAQLRQAPVATILDLADGAAVKSGQLAVRAAVRGGGPGTTVRALVDGRVVAAAVAATPEAQVAMQVPVPRRDFTLAVVAAGPQGRGEPHVVRLRGAAPGQLPRLWMLAVGVSAYPRKELRLTYPAKDAADLLSAWRAGAHRLYSGVDARLLTDAGASRTAILAGLEWLRRGAARNDTVVVYLAGHGITDPAGRYQYLPYDADPDRALESMIPEGLLREALAGIAGRLLLILDTCHAGGVMAGRGAADLTRLANELGGAEGGVVVFTAATGGQVAQESAAWGNGAFTKAMIEGLRGKADLRRTGRVTVNMLDLYVSERVRELTRGRQVPGSARPMTIPDFVLTGDGSAKVPPL
jgi:DNA-binding beta-propeller fold protein YncE